MSALLPRDATIGDLWRTLLECFPCHLLEVGIIRVPASESPTADVGQVVQIQVSPYVRGRGTTPYEAWLDFKHQAARSPMFHTLCNRIQTVEGMAFLQDYDA